MDDGIIQNSYDKLSVVVDNIPALVSYFDRECKYVYVNASYKRWFNLENTNVIGKHLSEVVGEAPYLMLKPYIDQVFAKEKNDISVELQTPYKHGGDKYVQVQLIADKDAEGEIKGVVVMVSDITERRKVESTAVVAREKAEHLLSAASQIINAFTIDAVLDQVTEQVIEVLKPERVAVFKPDYEKGLHIAIRSYGFVGIPAGQIIAFDIHDDGPISTCMQKHKSIFLKNKEEALSEFPYLVKYQSSVDQALAFLPITVLGKVECVLGISYNEERQWSVEEQIHLRTLMKFCSLAYEKAKLLEAERDSKQGLQRLFESTPVGIVVTSGYDYRLDYMNECAASMYDMDQSFWGKSLHDFSHSSKNSEVFESAEVTRKTGEPTVLKEFDIHMPNGDVVTVDIHIESRKSIFGEDHDGVVMFSLDVSDSIKARHEAEQLSEEKSRFLANMSHEIRTPLNAILGFTDILKQNDLSEEKRKSYSEIVKKNGRQLSALISDILDFSKIDSGHMQVEKIRVSTSSILQDIQNLFQMDIQKKGLTFNLEIDKNVPEQIVSDPVRLSQILTNLVSNAVKFTQKGAIEIQVKNLSEDQSAIGFWVKDTGIGLSQQQQSKLFSAFSQADSSTTRKFGGTGLGLALSKGLAQLLGGDLEIETSEVDKGSCFVVKIPTYLQMLHDLKAPEFIQETISADALKALEGSKVLVVDDSEDNRRLLMYYLKSTKVHMDFAIDGEEAFQKAIQKKYDVLLMDVEMPNVDGYQATRRLREVGYDRPIIALTANAMPEDRERSLDAGCNEHLTKPIDSKALIRRVAYYVSQQL